MAADLFDEHRVLVATAEQLLAVVRRMPRAPLDEITQLRVRLANLALAHLRGEDDVIIKPLMESGKLDQIPEAAALISEIRNGHSVYSDHVRKWTLHAVEIDRAGYADALTKLIDYLRKMIAREENFLYWPALRALTAKPTDQTG
jgi:hypothetical protein